MGPTNTEADAIIAPKMPREVLDLTAVKFDDGIPPSFAFNCE